CSPTATSIATATATIIDSDSNLNIQKRTSEHINHNHCHCLQRDNSQSYNKNTGNHNKPKSTTYGKENEKNEDLGKSTLSMPTENTKATFFERIYERPIGINLKPCQIPLYQLVQKSITIEKDNQKKLQKEHYQQQQQKQQVGIGGEKKSKKPSNKTNEVQRNRVLSDEEKLMQPLLTVLEIRQKPNDPHIYIPVVGLYLEAIKDFR